MMNKFKVGDEVKIIKKGLSHVSQNHFGEITIITAEFFYNDVYSVSIASGGVYDEEIELVKKEEIFYAD